MLRKFILRQISKRGYEITKPGYSDKNSVAYRKILESFGIDHIIDVGANEGQYAKALRKLGYKGFISSFEPLSEVFPKLLINAKGDQQWSVYNLALGNTNGKKNINISKNTVSSSLLEILPEHIKQEPESLFVNQEAIEVRCLDSIWNQFPSTLKNVFLKLDVQGFEKFVLEGAEKSLHKIKLIQLEMALTPLYKGELLLPEMVNHLNEIGFKLYNLMSGFSNFETGQLFQVDGIFYRSDINVA